MVLTAVVFLPGVGGQERSFHSSLSTALKERMKTIG